MTSLRVPDLSPGGRSEEKPSLPEPHGSDNTPVGVRSAPRLTWADRKSPEELLPSISDNGWKKRTCDLKNPWRFSNLSPNVTPHAPRSTIHAPRRDASEADSQN